MEAVTHSLTLSSARLLRPSTPCLPALTTPQPPRSGKAVIRAVEPAFWRLPCLLVGLPTLRSPDGKTPPPSSSFRKAAQVGSEPVSWARAGRLRCGGVGGPWAPGNPQTSSPSSYPPHGGRGCGCTLTVRTLLFPCPRLLEVHPAYPTPPCVLTRSQPGHPGALGGSPCAPPRRTATSPPLRMPRPRPCRSPPRHQLSEAHTHTHTATLAALSVSGPAPESAPAPAVARPRYLSVRVPQTQRPQPSGPGKVMVSLRGSSATSLLQVLFLGLSTFGELNPEPGGDLRWEMRNPDPEGAGLGSDEKLGGMGCHL